MPPLEELGPLLGDTETRVSDPDALDPYADEDAEFTAAAQAAVGAESKAVALRDAIDARLRALGLLGGTDDSDEDMDSDEDTGAIESEDDTEPMGLIAIG